MPGVFGLLELLMLFLGVVLCVFLRSCSASSRVCFRNPQSLETQTRLIDADILIWTFVRPTMVLVVASVQRISSIHIDFAISRHLRCLCDLDPMDFHRFFLHELLRETVDRWAWCIEDCGSGISKWKECMYFDLGENLKTSRVWCFQYHIQAVHLKNCFKHCMARMNSILNSHNLYMAGSTCAVFCECKIALVRNYLHCTLYILILSCSFCFRLICGCPVLEVKKSETPIPDNCLAVCQR